MAHHTIVSMPGDGIGKVVLPEAVKVLEKAGFSADYVHGDIGWDFWCSEGNALPDRTVALLEKHKIGLFGAITSKPKWDADAELDPQLRRIEGLTLDEIASLTQASLATVKRRIKAAEQRLSAEEP